MTTWPALALMIAAQTGDPAALFVDPQPVAIEGYGDDAMEPFISRDGRYLFFNSRPDAPNTELHYAEAVDGRWRHRGFVQGVNTPALDAVASLDRAQTFYFISTRSYEQSLSTVYRGRFDAGVVSGIELVPGISLLTPGQVNFDIDISSDGDWLYFVDSLMTPSGPVTADLSVARRRGSGFQRAEQSAALLAAINTADLEYAPAVTSDGLTLLYTRAIRVPLDVGIYAAFRKRRDLPFSAGVRLSALTGFVEAASFTPDENSIYFHKLDGDRFVIYRARRP